MAIEPIDTAPALNLIPREVEVLIEGLRAYQAIYSSLLQRRAAAVVRIIHARLAAEVAAQIDGADGPGAGKRPPECGPGHAAVYPRGGLG